MWCFTWRCVVASRRRPNNTRVSVLDGRHRARPAAVRAAARRHPANSENPRRPPAARAEQRQGWRETARGHRSHSSTDVGKPERADDDCHRPVVNTGRSATTQHRCTPAALEHHTDTSSAAGRRQRTTSPSDALTSLDYTNLGGRLSRNKQL